MAISVLPGYWVSGVKVTVLPLTAYDPATTSLVALTYTKTVFGFTEAASMRLLMVNETGLVTDTPVAPLTGLIELMVNEPLP